MKPRETIEMEKEQLSRKIAYYGIFGALAILAGYVEAMVPVPLPVPGIKLGLSNVVVLLALYTMGSKQAFGISIVRVAVSALLFKGMTGLWYSAAGAVLSFVVMSFAQKTEKFSIAGVSILGGIFHNMGQLLAAWFILGRAVVIYLAPVLTICGAITGFAIGVISEMCVKHINVNTK